MARPERADAMCKLLALEPMPYLELMQAMGGDLAQARDAFDYLLGRGYIHTLGSGPGRLVGLQGGMS